MTKQSKYRGAVAPMVTPFRNGGEIDLEAAARVTEHLVAAGVAPFPLGTTGEAASIAPKARAEFVATVVRHSGHRTVVYVGISDNCLAVSIEMAKRYADLGTDVAVAHLPTCYPLGDDEIKGYYEELAQRIPLPLMMYNIPVTTGMSISLDTLEHLSRHPNIVGLKDSEKNTERLQQAMFLWKDRVDFVHMMGCGALCALALQMGSDGIVPGAANVAPRLFADLYEAGSNGRQEESSRLQELADGISAIFHTNRTLSQSLPTLKAMMHLLGFCQAEVLPPLRTLTSSQLQAVSKDWAALKRVLGKEGYTMTGPGSTVPIPTRETRHPVEDAGLRDTVPVRGDRQS
jgi:dihydrodipicolinate synthase/N-acetylneuraminate lyase